LRSASAQSESSIFAAFYYDSKGIRTAVAATLAITYFSTLFVILEAKVSSCDSAQGGRHS
jgi:hypothetical protein